MYQRFFVVSTIVLLVATGVSKVFSASQPTLILEYRDPVFYFINSRHIMWLAGGLEVALAVFLWCRRNSEIVFPVIGTLAAVLIIYRLGAYWTGHKSGGDCGCLGNAAQWLVGDPAYLNKLSLGLLAYWVSGLVLWAAGKWRRTANLKAAALGLALLLAMSGVERGLAGQLCKNPVIGAFNVLSITPYPLALKQSQFLKSATSARWRSENKNKTYKP